MRAYRQLSKLRGGRGESCQEWGSQPRDEETKRGKTSDHVLKFKILAKNVGVSQESRDVRPLTLDQTLNNKYWSKKYRSQSRSREFTDVRLLTLQTFKRVPMTLGVKEIPNMCKVLVSFCAMYTWWWKLWWLWREKYLRRGVGFH